MSAMKKVYNKDEFVRRLTLKGYTIEGGYAAVDDVFETIREIMLDNCGVKIRGFGTFEVRERAPRVSISPGTKETVEVPARKAAFFNAGTLLKEQIGDLTNAL